MYKLEAIAQEVSTLLADAYAKHIKRELPEVERQTLRSLVQEAVQGEGDEFVLRIRLGDDRMRTMRDVAFALLDVSDRLKRGQSVPKDARIREYKEMGTIRDINGNAVGGWQFWRRG